MCGLSLQLTKPNCVTRRKVTHFLSFIESLSKAIVRGQVCIDRVLNSHCGKLCINVETAQKGLCQISPLNRGFPTIFICCSKSQGNPCFSTVRMCWMMCVQMDICHDLHITTHISCDTCSAHWQI